MICRGKTPQRIAVVHMVSFGAIIIHMYLQCRGTPLSARGFIQNCRV